MVKFEEAVCIITDTCIDGDYEVMLDYCEENQTELSVDKSSIYYPFFRHLFLNEKFDIQMSSTSGGKNSYKCQTVSVRFYKEEEYEWGTTQTTITYFCVDVTLWSTGKVEILAVTNDSYFA